MAGKLFDVKQKTESDFIATMVMESMKLLNSYNYEIKFKFLLGVVTHILLSALKAHPEEPCSKEELFKFTEANFAAAKHNVQEMVAGAFSQALSLYSGKNMNYTCKVAPVKDVVPKLTH